MRTDRNQTFALCLAISLAAHGAAAWLLPDRTTTRVVDFGEEAVVAVRLFEPRPVAPVAPSAPPVTPTPRRPPPPEPVAKKLEPRTDLPPPPPEPVPVAITTPSSPATATTPAVSAPPPLDDAVAAPRGFERDWVAEYVERINGMIRDQKRYPKLARKRKIEGRVVVVLEIDAEGALSSLRMAEGAPRVLRSATEAAIRRAAPFPSPPDGSKTIEVQLEYTLRDVS